MGENFLKEVLPQTPFQELSKIIDKYTLFEKFLGFREPFFKKVLGEVRGGAPRSHTPRPARYAAILATVSSLSLPMSMK